MRKLYSIALILITLALGTTAFAADAATSGVVNINTAGAEQLSLLPRIGEKAAQRIIDYRTEHGPFKQPSDLMDVKGVGAKSFALMAPYVAVSGETTLTAKVRTPRAKK